MMTHTSGQVGGQHLCLYLPLQGDHHVHLLVIFLKSEVCDCEHDQVFVIELQLLEIFFLIVFVHHKHLFDNRKEDTDELKVEIIDKV